MDAPEDDELYPRRRPGLDHDWFVFRRLAQAPRLEWPEGATVAVWIGIHVEFFPLDMEPAPVRPVGSPVRRYPDYASFTNRDYGNRVGIFRVMRVLDRLGLPATALVNAAVARRYPPLMDAIAEAGWEVAANGLDMGRTHHSGLTREEEEAMVRETMETLEASSSRPVAGWHSPGFSQSFQTLELVAGQGLRYVADWVNDDAPYTISTPAGPLSALPHSHELSDATLLIARNQSLDDYGNQLVEAFTHLVAEAKAAGSGRVMSIPLHPWIIGQPHRIRMLETVLGQILATGEAWFAGGTEIVERYSACENRTGRKTP